MKSINNKLIFNIYVWIRFCFLIFVIVYLLFIFIGNENNDKALTSGLTKYALIYLFIGILFKLFDYLIKPSYFEALILNGQICIKSFNPNKRNGFRFMFIIFYKKYLIEQIINRQSYNNYKLVIDFFGLRKSLIFQKIYNGNIYESNPINISFLGAKKYTDLILSIDRLKEKLTMN